MKFESPAARTFIPVTVIGLFLSTLGCNSPKKTVDEDEEGEVEEFITINATTCGVEREAVKTGTDTTANLVNLTPQDTTIANLRAFPMPATIPSTTRIPNSPETQLWRINATLTLFKLETDSDFHLVIADSSGATMITELASPSCDAGSLWSTQIAHARTAFTAKFTPTSTFTTVSIPVTVTGVGMFDFAHGQTGAAPNQIELHPVLDICFPGSSVSGCTTAQDFSLSTNPGSLTTAAGASSTSSISIAGSGGFAGTVALTASGVPAGASSSFSSASVASGGTSTLTLSAGTAAAGTYTVTVTGTSGGITHSATITWTISTGTTACAHSICLTGGTLVASCDPCATKVCAADSFCCSSSWDSQCIGEVDSICHESCSRITCAHSACTTGGVLSSTCDTCVNAICTKDSFCCNSSWDSACVSEVSSICMDTCF